jgi:gamma-F420-2:alpha-L-glutamate ligase
MLAWLIYNRDSANYNKRYIEFYIEEGEKLGITVRLILVEELEFGVRNNTWFLSINGVEPEYPDFVICRAIYPLLSRQLEYMGLRVFNNAFLSEICNDKAKTYQYLAGTGIRMVDTSFYKNELIEEAVCRIVGTTIIKAVEGHGGTQVFLLNQDTDSTEKERSKKGIGSSDIVLQPFTGSRHQDLRVYVIGKEIIAAVLRTAKEGFKSNFSLGGEVRLYELSEEEKSIVRVIMDRFEIGLVGIDFIIGDEGELIFNEIEDVVGSRMLYQCSDINIVEKYLTHIKNRLSSPVSKGIITWKDT